MASTTDVFNDGLDATFSNLAEIAMEIETPRGSKRPNSSITEVDEDESQSKRVRTFSMERLKEELTVIEATTSLALFDVVENYLTDPIVKSYADKLLEMGFFPTLPTTQEELMRIQAPTVKVDLSPECQKYVISTLMDFFRTVYFKKNMQDAYDANKVVIPVKAPCMMPGFQFTPLEYLERDYAILHSAGIQMQKNGELKAKFVSELMLVYSASCIFEEVKRQVNLLVTQQIATQQLIDVYYYKAKLEFMKKFNIKIFDWENYTSKVKLILPKWRRENLPPPTQLHNRYATDIVERITAGKESFRPEQVRKDFLDFVNKGKQPPKPATSSHLSSSLNAVTGVQVNQHASSSSSSRTNQNAPAHSSHNGPSASMNPRKKPTFNKRNHNNQAHNSSNHRQEKPHHHNYNNNPTRSHFRANNNHHQHRHQPAPSEQDVEAKLDRIS